MIPSTSSTLFSRIIYLLVPTILLTSSTGSWCSHEESYHHENSTATRARRFNNTGYRHLFDQGQELDACRDDNYGSSKCTDSIRTKPPFFFRMLWLDETSVVNETTGFWAGNAITLKYTLGKEFLLLTHFEKLEDSFEPSPMFYSTFRAYYSVERLRRRVYTPAGANFFNQITDNPDIFEEHKPRFVFRFGRSNFQLNVLHANQIEEEPPGVDDQAPNLDSGPKCYALRYMIYRGGPVLPAQVYEFKSTPVTIFYRLNRKHKLVTMAKVSKRHDSFYYYHGGMPIVCNDKLAYIIKTSLDEKRPSKEIQVVRIDFLMGQIYKWVSKSIYKSLDGMPLPEVKPAFIRFG